MVCRKCRRRSLAGSAILPGAVAVVCPKCFKELLGYHPLPPGRPIDAVTLRKGQLLSEQAREALGLPDMVPPEGVTTPEELDAILEEWDEELQTVGDDAQLANLDMQNMLQKQQQTMQMMSNISKMLHDTAMAVIRKMGG